MNRHYKGEAGGLEITVVLHVTSSDFRVYAPIYVAPLLHFL